MNNKKYIIITVLILILILGFSYWLLNRSKGVQLTDEQKLDILSKMSGTSTVTVSDEKKQEILKTIDTNIKPTSNLSAEEKLQILNKTK